MSVFPTAPPEGGPPAPWTFPAAHEATLSNGLSVLVLPEHRLPIVQLRLVSRVGRWLEGPHERGLCRLLAMTTRHGTERFSSAELAHYQDALGLRLSSSISPDDRSVAVKALAEHVDEAFVVLGELATRPLFPEEHLSREAEKSVQARRQQLASPDSLAGEWFSWAIYGPDHPYGRRRPEAEDFLVRTRDEVLAWQERHFGPEHALLVVVGDVEAKRALDLAESALGHWRPAQPLPALPTAPGRRPKRVVLVDRPGSEQATILVGNKGIGRTAPTYDDARVMNRVLGGGASSRLFMDLRETRSLTYGVYSALDGGRFGGDHSASLSCATDKADEALSALFEHARRIRDEPVTDEELDGARRYLCGAFPMGASSLGGLASLLTARWLNGLPEDVWETWVPRVAAVTVEDVQAAAKALVRPEDGVLVVVGEGDALEPLCARYGEVLRVSAEDRPPAVD